MLLFASRDNACPHLANSICSSLHHAWCLAASRILQHTDSSCCTVLDCKFASISHLHHCRYSIYQTRFLHSAFPQTTSSISSSRCLHSDSQSFCLSTHHFLTQNIAHTEQVHRDWPHSTFTSSTFHIPRIQPATLHMRHFAYCVATCYIVFLHCAFLLFAMPTTCFQLWLRFATNIAHVTYNILVRRRSQISGKQEFRKQGVKCCT